MVGSVVPRERGGLVLAAGRALVATDLDGGGAETLVEVEPDRPENRFNDCRVDPAGRFFGGTKVNDPDLEGRGALYRIGPDLSPTVAIADTGIANGIGWSPDGTTLYFIDSPLQRSTPTSSTPRPATSEPAAPSPPSTPKTASPTASRSTPRAASGWPLSAPPPSAASPRPAKSKPNSTSEVRNPTCPGFGGPDLRTLYLTSAHLRTDPQYADAPPRPERCSP